MTFATMAENSNSATPMQLAGAFLFGAVIGWFVYFVNRHRGGEVQLTDVGTLIAAIGAGAVLALFPAGTDLFGAYGIGLGVGFFLYFGILILIISLQRSKQWTFEWFLDGRAPKLRSDQAVSSARPLGDQHGGPQ